MGWARPTAAPSHKSVPSSVGGECFEVLANAYAAKAELFERSFDDMASYGPVE